MNKISKNVELVMVGNSHIDPVWFWNKEEGFQEVKATFISALARMKEYPDFTFTASSSAFFSYIEQIAPALFNEIKQRVSEGRFELVGGWVVEADCCMPDGESLVRQGLYGQRFFKSRFGKICTIGFAPDTFGHAQTIPMLILGAGMSSYCHQRPNTPKNALSNWKSEDDSEVLEFHLPSEYTIWFEEQLQKAITQCIPHIENGGSLPCFYGVGNHGGGPTIENIETLKRYQNYHTEKGDAVTLKLGTLESFFSKVDRKALPNTSGGREGLGGGCYAVDSKLKKQMRMAEHSVLRAEKLWTMATLMGCKLPAYITDPPNEFEEIWKNILFNQFHDIICGTCIKSARDSAVMEFGSTIVRAKKLENYAVQAIANMQNTYGEGFPLFLFNPHLEAFSGVFEAEIPWFCKAHMALLDENNNEISYQRVKPDCTMVNYNLSGRRKIIFFAKIPAFGFSTYRLVEREPSVLCDMGTDSVTVGLPVCKKTHLHQGIVGLMSEVSYTLENEHIKVRFNSKTGLPYSILDKNTNYESLLGAMEVLLYTDTGDSWGSGGIYSPSDERLSPTSMRLIENGFLRKVARVKTKSKDCCVKWCFTLYSGEKELHCAVRIVNNTEHKSLVWNIPLAEQSPTVRVQIPHGTALRAAQGAGNYMQGFLDASQNSSGLSVYNNGRYCYSLTDNLLSIPLSRSAIYAHGGLDGWQSDNLDLDYTDTGLSECDFLLCPHSDAISSSQLHRRTMRFNQPPLYLFDTWHDGESKADSLSLLSCNESDVILTAAKPAQDGGTLLRLLETQGSTKNITLALPKQEMKINATLQKKGLLNLLIKDNEAVCCNFLEQPSIQNL